MAFGWIAEEKAGPSRSGPSARAGILPPSRVVLLLIAEVVMQLKKMRQQRPAWKKVL